MVDLNIHVRAGVLSEILWRVSSRSEGIGNSKSTSITEGYRKDPLYLTILSRVGRGFGARFDTGPVIRIVVV
jgi:hypothetical protein